jgi:hypothetical protein
MRDPMFYVFYKRIYFFYEAFANRMPEYKKSDFAFDGVKFESVEMDKLLTYFDLVRNIFQKNRTFLNIFLSISSPLTSPTPSMLQLTSRTTSTLKWNSKLKFLD